jgi:aldehyde dehydrogenase (NAD+)
MPHPHPFLDGAPKKLLIAGQWVDALAGETFPAINPATGETLAHLPRARAADMDRAVAAARHAFCGTWRATTPAARQALLLRVADLTEAHAGELAELDTLDMGAPIRHTRGAMDFLVAMLRFYAAQALALNGETIPNSAGGAITSFTLREPLGVVGAIVPWNGPMWALVWKIGPVLATGCTMVLKASEEAGLTALRFGALLQQAGVPAGVVNICTGLPDAGAALAAHPDVDKISFTGSVETGQQIVRASAGNLKRLTLELGGKSPNIIFPEADLPRAAATAGIAAFANCGQVCSAGSRLFVHRSVLDEVVDRLSASTRALRIGPGIDPRTDLGPLASAAQQARVARYIGIGQAEGATLLQGGGRPDDAALHAGRFITPAIFTGVQDGMAIAREEIFGPVLCVLGFDEEEEVFARANATRFGLGAAVWTRDIGRAQRAMRALRAGSVWINGYNLVDPAVPCGGVAMSGYGREGGQAQINDYLSLKSVWLGG